MNDVIGRLGTRKDMKKEVFKQLEKKPTLTTPDLKILFPKMKEGTLRTYRWEFRRMHFPVFQVNEDVRIFYEMFLFKVQGKIQINMNKREKIAIMNIQSFLKNEFEDWTLQLGVVD